MDFEKPPSFSAVDISVIIHATEDENKVLESLSTILCVHPNKFRHMESIGHWGNRIILTTGRLESAEANTLIKKILNSLNSMEREQTVARRAPASGARVRFLLTAFCVRP